MLFFNANRGTNVDARELDDFLPTWGQTARNEAAVEEPAEVRIERVRNAMARMRAQQGK